MRPSIALVIACAILLDFSAVVDGSAGCDMEVDAREPCGLESESEWECRQLGCCWLPCDDCHPSTPHCYFSTVESLPKDGEVGGFDFENDLDELPVSGLRGGEKKEDFDNLPPRLETSPADPGREGEVRLVDGPGPRTGRVEIYHSGVWGTVCDDDFTDHAATVVCRQLGRQNGQVTPFQNPGTGAIMMDDVYCTGNELGLADCSFAGWFHNDCSHEEDVEVHCNDVPRNYIYSDTDDVRLLPRGRLRGLWGRVEVFHDGIWGTVCDDGLKERYARRFIRVVCRQMGGTGEGVILNNNQNRLYGDTPIIWMDEVICRGNEATLTRCDSQGWRESDCTHNEDVVIRCTE